MNIAVLVKPVPDPDEYHLITIDPETRRLNRGQVPSVLNPADKSAIEQALQLKEAHGGEVTVYAMAPSDGQEKLRDCLAMGADKAFLVSDRLFGGADTWATAYTLSEAIKQTGEYDLILAGNESADGATGHVPTQVGEFMGWSHLTTVKAVKMGEDGILNVSQKREGGTADYRITLPAVLGMTRDSQKPRYTSAMGVIKSKKKPLVVLSCSDLELKDENLGLSGSPTQAGEMLTPETGRNCREISGSADETAAEVIRLIDAAGIGRVLGESGIKTEGVCEEYV